jgi:hypothetical protein
MTDYLFKRHFTVDEANALLPHVLSVFERIHAIGTDLEKHQKAFEKLHAHAPGNGGSKKSSDLLGFSESITRLLQGLEEQGILIKDPQSGLIDFPHIREDREVLLCWKMGEKKVDFWHEVETGYRGRQPL